MTQNIDVRLALLHKAADKNPDDFTIRQRLVSACAQGGRHEEAVREFNALVETAPDFPQVHFESLGQVSSVCPVAHLLDAFERATRADADDWVAWYGLGLLRQTVHDHEGAVEAFKAGVLAAPVCGLLQYNLGVALMDEPLQAEMWLTEAARYNPRMAEPHYTLATLFMTRDQRRAAHHFREFIRLAPPHLQGFANQAGLSLQLLGESE